MSFALLVSGGDRRGDGPARAAAIRVSYCSGVGVIVGMIERWRSEVRWCQGNGSKKGRS